ncbi:MAG: hypothetical protein EXS41_11280 [Opitutaceae bacterium]|nr:hypothetical protein [Opitutaceae bacterium]
MISQRSCPAQSHPDRIRWFCARALLPLLLAWIAPALHAGPIESGIVAAMKLPEAKSYSWVSLIEDDARSYDITGQTDKSDFSIVSMPMISAIRRRVSRGSANSDNQVDVIFKGAEHCVIQTPDGWKTPAELANAPRPDQRPGGPGDGGGFPAGGFLGGGPSRRGRKGSGPPGTPPPYSNLQLNLSRPHEEIGLIIGSYTEIQSDGDIITGTLSETGAKLLLVHAGQNELTPLKASGTFRLWVTNGSLEKYELRLDGTLSVETPSARRQVEVHQKSTTEIKAIGTTNFDVPEEARKKLGVEQSDTKLPSR